jgi:division protein CdvB (Snf7/Vps24/ESCRT-III family)
MNSRWVKSESILDSSSVANNNSNGQGTPLPKPGGPLKPRLDAIQKKIQVQISRLEEIYDLLKLKDRDIFDKLTLSMKQNNAQHSALILSELTKTRQVSRVVILSCIGLEKLIAKLSSVSDFGDLVAILSPAMAVVKNLRSSLTPHLPEMEEKLGIISELLSGILVDAGQVGGYTINFELANGAAVRLIAEARLGADLKIKEELPDIPELPMISLRFA